MGADSLAPLIAFAGLLGTSVVIVMGTGLDTEFISACRRRSDEQIVDPANAALFNHWIGTIPWIWVLAGLAGTGVYAVGRTGGVPRWIGRVGLVLGGITLLLGISPLQYMAGMTGPLLAARHRPRLLPSVTGPTAGLRSTPLTAARSGPKRSGPGIRAFTMSRC